MNFGGSAAKTSVVLQTGAAFIPASTHRSAGTVNTGGPGSSATAGVNLNGGVLHFDFTIRAGQNGEVTQAQLSNDLVNNANATFKTIMPLTSNNSNAVQPIASTDADPEKEEIRLKIEELILALRR